MEFEFREKFISNINVAQSVIKDILERINGNLDEDNLFDLRLILNELICNSIIHGNLNIEDKLVSLVLLIDSETIEISVSDEGEGIGSVPDYIKNEMKNHGRGLVIVKGLSDDFNIIGHTVKVMKKLA
ncbi:MAG: ATP-binding protein [Tissierellales bacterium]|nr:ATP-binding protein [Tissierellales bacterium]MBN2826742.1 ATP-binding protein [Tissierellales bacterium]